LGSTQVSLKKKAAIVGVYEHPTRYAPSKTSYQLIAEAARGALEDAGLTIKDVDGMFNAGAGGILASLALADYLNINPAYTDTTNFGGSSFVGHAGHAAAAIAAGTCDVALITYSATPVSTPGGGVIAGAMGGDPSSQFELPYGVTIINGYAMTAHRHMHEYGTTSEQLAEISATMRLHASMNPNAKYRDPITVEDVLKSRIISSPLHLLDCCVVSDGAGAVVMTSAERARDLRKKPVYILGTGEGMRHGSSGKRNLLDIATNDSGRMAFERAGLKPKDIDMAMIYDSFTITVLMQLEALGFCKHGEGGAFVSGGRLRYDGEFPINTDGGGLSSNHPGMRGIFLLIEATKQLRGEGGPRQAKKPLTTAVASGIGGNLGYRHAAATAILSNQ
jgi:acetyl-CoA C-acetyltransferase